jgi:hypothetical protein
MACCVSTLALMVPVATIFGSGYKPDLSPQSLLSIRP